MNADFLKDKLHFKEGLKNSYYKKIDGFLYTVGISDDSEIFLFINLPQTEDSFKKSFAEFLKENVKKLLKERVVKNGFKLTLSADAFDKNNYIVKTAQQISEYLTSQGISFGEKKHKISFKNNMYVFDVDEVDEKTPKMTEEIAEEIITENEENALEETKNTESEKLEVSEEKILFTDKIPTQILILIIYLLCGGLFMLLSHFNISVAAATGYLMGWLPAAVLVRRKKKNVMIFFTVTFLSLVTLLLAGAYSFLYLFLSQNEIFSVFDFFTKSLSLAHCAFNVALGLLLSMFGTYSTLPAKKKQKKDIDIDFE